MEGKILICVLLCSLSKAQQCNEERLSVMNNNKEGCHMYFTCDKDGQVAEVDCPHGLFWNKNMSYCDLPGKDTCQVTESEIDLLRPIGEKFIYLTFDDGPWVGTAEVLDVLKEQGIKNVYRDPETDAKYFGNKNFEKVSYLMRKAGINEDKQKQVSDIFHKFARMPYTNNWRIKEFREDCPLCSTPPYSALNGILTSDVLKEKYGTNVIGWDQQWEVNWSESRCHKFDAIGLLMRLMTVPTKLKNKIVVLSHEFLYFGKDGWGVECKRQNLVQLELFIKWSKQLGYKFRTINTYLEDRPTGTVLSNASLGPQTITWPMTWTFFFVNIFLLFNITV